MVCPIPHAPSSYPNAASSKQRKAKDDTSHLAIMPTSEQARLKPDLAEIDGSVPDPLDSLSTMLSKQFQLLRFDCTASFRAAISQSVKDLNDMNEKSGLVRVLEEKGGMYDPGYSGCSTVPVPLNSDFRFIGFALDTRLGLVFQISAAAPPGPARSCSKATREDFWKQSGTLASGGMIALLSYERGRDTDVRMATIASDVECGGRTGPNGAFDIRFSIAFTNPFDAKWAKQQITFRDTTSTPLRFLLQNPVSNSYMSILAGLQERAADHNPSLAESIISCGPDSPRSPPYYTLARKFVWDLSHLMPAELQEIGLRLWPDDFGSAENARRQFQRILDPSQADALVSALTTNSALINGPARTGKTFIVIQLLQTMMLNNVGPIVLLAQTDYELDRILRGVIDSGVTTEIVRLGAESEDPLLRGFALKDRRSKFQDGEDVRSLEAELSKIETDFEALSTRLMALNHVDETLRTNHHLHHYNLHAPPAHVRAFIDDFILENGGSLQREGGGGQDSPMWQCWADGMDIKAISRLAKMKGKVAQETAGGAEPTEGFCATSQKAWDRLFEKGSWDPETNARTRALNDKVRFLDHFNFAVLPSISKSNRELAELLPDPNVWFYSARERRKYRQHVEEQTKARLNAMRPQRIDGDCSKDERRHAEWRSMHETRRLRLQEARSEASAIPLDRVRIIGCAAGGMADMLNILEYTYPSILVVVEAHQTLEAHILAALSPSVQHVIQIGDLQQLRAKTNCYDLSMESDTGEAKYRLNQSMMERLASAGYPASTLQTRWSGMAITEAALGQQLGGPAAAQWSASTRAFSKDLVACQGSSSSETAKPQPNPPAPYPHGGISTAAYGYPSIQGINRRIMTSIDGLILPSPGNLPHRQTLNDMLSLKGIPYPDPVDSAIFSEDLDDIISFDPKVKLAWLEVSDLVMVRYAKLDLLPVSPDDPLPILSSRIRDILQSILCRLVLSLLARQFADLFRDRGPHTPEMTTRANYVAHLFDILMWTLLRSCERDIQLADVPYATAAARVALVGCRILLSQSIVLTALNEYADQVQTDRMLSNDRMLASAEGVTGGLVQELRVAAEAESEQGDDGMKGKLAGLEALQGFWGEIRACKKSGRGYEAAKGLKEGLNRMVELLEF